MKCQSERLGRASTLPRGCTIRFERRQRGCAPQARPGTQPALNCGMWAVTQPLAGLLVPLLCACALAVILPAHLALHAWRSKSRLDLPRMPGPRGRPLVGNLADMLRPNFHKVLARWAATYGEVFRISILGLDGVVVASPEAVGAVLGLRGPAGSEVPKHAQSYWSLDVLWGNGSTHTVITGLSTDTWKTVHRAVAPCFSSLAVRCGRVRPGARLPPTPCLTAGVWAGGQAEV